jgi:hypothetical protein
MGSYRIAVALLRRAAHEANLLPIPENGSRLLCMPYGRFVLWLCGLCMAFPFGFAALFFYLVFTNLSGFDFQSMVVSLTLGIAFLACGLWFFVELFMTEVLFSEDGIVLRRFWRRQIERFPWETISHLRYSDANHWLIMTSRTGRKVRVSRFRRGFTKFWEIAESQLEREVTKHFFSRLHSKEDHSGLRPNGW